MSILHETGRSGGSRRRRGYSTLLLLLLLPVLILFLAWVVNWVYLAFVQRHMTSTTDVVAWAGVVGLLDEEVLMDMPPDDSDDQADASAVVNTYLSANNDVRAGRLQLEMSDLTVTPGRVEDVTMPISGMDFDQNPPPGEPYNTLRIEAERDAGGSNPVEPLIRNFGAIPDAVTISSASYVALDSRVVGFAPTPNGPTPAAPMAIESDAWFTTRPATMDDSFNGNGRYELDLVLISNLGAGSANSALIDVDATAPFELASLPGEIEDGIFPSDMPSTGGEFGPIPVDVPATQISPGAGDPIDTDDLVDAFNDVAASSRPERVFMLYEDPFADPLTIVGFVGAVVLEAENIGAGGDDRLRVRVEPGFVVHFTYTTDPSQDENLYLHKIRLVK